MSSGTTNVSQPSVVASWRSAPRFSSVTAVMRAAAPLSP
jgi:hypothetical protein